MLYKRRFSVKEFAKLMGLSEENIRQKCREQKDKRRPGKAAMKLPDGYLAEHCNCKRDWIIGEALDRDLESRHSSEDEDEDEDEDEGDYDENDGFYLSPSSKSSASLPPSRAVRKENPPPEIRQAASSLAEWWQYTAKQVLSASSESGLLEWNDLLINPKPYPAPRAANKPLGPLKHSDQLLQLVGRCFALAVCKNKTINICLTFGGDGSWKPSLVSPTDDPLLCDHVLFDGKYRNLLRNWAFEIHSAAKGSRTPWKFLDRKYCLECFATLKDSSDGKQRRYCSDCTAANHIEFIKRQITQSNKKSGRTAIQRRLLDLERRTPK